MVAGKKLTNTSQSKNAAQLKNTSETSGTQAAKKKTKKKPNYPKVSQFVHAHKLQPNRKVVTRVGQPKVRIAFARNFPQPTLDEVRKFFGIDALQAGAQKKSSSKARASNQLQWESVQWDARHTTEPLNGGMLVECFADRAWRVAVRLTATDTPARARNRLYNALSMDVTVSLLPQQQVLVQKFKDFDWRNADKKAEMLYWKMGSGKTYGALSAISAGLYSESNKPRSNVLIVCSKTLTGNWLKAIRDMPQDAGETKFVILGYDEFRKTFHEQPDGLPLEFGPIEKYIVVLDEAHNYRNLTPRMLLDVQLLRRARFLFLLTGTPIQNEPSEMCAMLALLRCCAVDLAANDSLDESNEFDVEDPFDCDPTAMMAQKDSIEKEMRRLDNVFYYDPATYDPARFASHYPDTTEVVQNVEMSPQQSVEYVLSMSSRTKFCNTTIQTARRNSYHSLTRAISNVIDASRPQDSPKICAVVENIVSGKHRGPHVVFSHYLKRGVYAVCKLLKEKTNDLRIVTLEGDTEGKQRDNIIEAYNNGRIDVLFITDAAKEGVDLQGTGTMHVLESAQNMHDEGQTMSRVARFGSHTGLPRDQQKVKFIKYHSNFPSRKTLERARAEINQYYEQTYRLSAGDCDIVSELLRMFEEHGKDETVDQQFARNNIEKAKALAPWLDLLQSVGNKVPEVHKAMQERQEATKANGTAHLLHNRKRPRMPTFTSPEILQLSSQFKIHVSSPQKQQQAAQEQEDNVTKSVSSESKKRRLK